MSSVTSVFLGVTYVFFIVPYSEESRNAQTVFRDKTGRKRDLYAERQEKSRQDGEKAEKDEKYAQWGRG